MAKWLRIFVIVAWIVSQPKVWAEPSDGMMVDAAREGDLSRLQTLIVSGTNINAKDENGATPLMLASQADRADIVKVLISAKADVNAKAVNGVTPLIAASGMGHAKIVRLLVGAGADVNVSVESGATALFAAAQEGYPDVVQLLIAAGADVNAKTADGTTLIMISSSKGYASVLRVILKSKKTRSSVDTKLSNGRTALMMASAAGNSEAVQVLLAAKADVNLKDSDGDTAYKAAWRSKLPYTAAVLKKAGASIDVPGCRPHLLVIANGTLTELHVGGEQFEPVFDPEGTVELIEDAATQAEVKKVPQKLKLVCHDGFWLGPYGTVLSE
jgi:uncharacterized protein